MIDDLLYKSVGSRSSQEILSLYMLYGSELRSLESIKTDNFMVYVENLKVEVKNSGSNLIIVKEKVN